MVAYIIVGLIAYLLGSISFSVIISKKMAGFDVREKGSGNAGSTNVLRSVGKKAAALTLLGDVLKGVVAILIAFILGLIIGEENISRALLVQIAGFFVILGHTFPVFFKFKGGKGIATALGILIITNWQIGLICLVFALIIMAATKMVSLGSIMAAVLFPILVIFVPHNAYIADGNYIIYSLILAALVIFNHRENVKRLLEGKENKLSFKK
ncbi:MAG: glycerol-3-phosphate 1-O-acyltransferase PlsY [Clostridia bacterium]|nr:glycerol-3-phosphate 1-O-acyltransferase PlsY [Clostridia bacterium]